MRISHPCSTQELRKVYQYIKLDGDKSRGRLSIPLKCGIARDQYSHSAHRSNGRFYALPRRPLPTQSNQRHSAGSGVNMHSGTWAWVMGKSKVIASYYCSFLLWFSDMVTSVTADFGHSHVLISSIQWSYTTLIRTHIVINYLISVRTELLAYLNRSL